jgi:hypothetical protein
MQGRSFIGFGLAVGVAIGAGLGVALDNLAVGIGLGVAIGAGLGIAIDGRRRKARDGAAKSSDGGSTHVAASDSGGRDKTPKGESDSGSDSGSGGGDGGGGD